MAKSSTRRVTIYINGKEVEASVKQIRSEMNKLVNEHAWSSARTSTSPTRFQLGMSDEELGIAGRTVAAWGFGGFCDGRKNSDELAAVGDDALKSGGFNLATFI